MLKAYIVDDEQWVIDELLEIVDWESLGYSVCGCSDDPLKAYEEILNLRPHFILCDICMEGMTGLELAAKINAVYESEICFLSAYDKFEYAVQALKVRAREYLTKPVKVDEIVSLLKEIKDKFKNKFLGEFFELVFSEEEAPDISQDIENKLMEYGILRADKSYRFVAWDSVKKPNRFESLSGEKVIYTFTNEFGSISLVEGNIADYKDIFSNCLASEAFSGANNIFKNARNLARKYIESCCENYPKEDDYVHRIICEITEDIKKNYNKRLSLYDYSLKYHYNLSYLSQMFKKINNMNFIDYLVYVRICKAKELIQSSDLSLVEIAKHIGYDDYCHFSKLFKKYVKCSPRYFKENYCNNNTR